LSTEFQNTLNLFDSDYENCIVYDRFSDLFALICDTIANIDEVFNPSNESEMNVPENSAARSVSVDSDSNNSDSSDSDSSDDFDFVTSVEPEDKPEDKKEDYGLYAPYYEMKKEFNALAEKYQQEFDSLTEISKLISKSLGREPTPHTSDDDEINSVDSSSTSSASRESSKDNSQVQTLFFAARNSNRSKESSNNQNQSGPRM